MDDPGFELLLEEGPCLVVNKPGGLLTQAPPTIDSLEQRVRRYLRAREQRTGNFYLAVTHRLDRCVSGAVILARHVRAARRICAQFERRDVTKTYWAIVEGVIADEQGTWIDTMRKVPQEPRAELVAADHPDAREAILHFRRLACSAAETLLEIRLETGRMHQIRLQAAARGFPVRGDEAYGAQTLFGPPSNDWRARWIALHARQIAFQHPMTRQPVAITASFSPAWEAALSELPK